MPHEDALSEKRSRLSYESHSVQLLPDEPGMTGYLARFNVVTDRGTFFKRGAFTKTIAEKPAQPHLWQHWSDLIIGVNKEPEQDKTGLKIKVALFENDELGARVMNIYREGQQNGWVPDWSIGFDRIKDRTATEEEMAGLDFTGAGPYRNAPVTELRAITEASWWEGSTVTFGAIHNAGPDVIHRQMTAPADLQALLIAAREGRLTADQIHQVDDLTAAIEARAGAGEIHSTPNQPSQDQHAAALDLLFFELGIIDGVAA